MKRLYKRFGIEVNRKEAEKIFRQKLENLLVHGELGEKLFDEQEAKIDIAWELAVQIGIEYKEEIDDWKKYYNIFNQYLDFKEYLFRIQVMLNILWENNQKNLSKKIGTQVQKVFEESPIDLGMKIVIYKIKPPQILPTVSKFIDKEIEDTIGLLETEQYSDILESFEGGLKLFLKAKTKNQFKDVIEDMLSACDEVVKVVTGDKNKGLKHVFKKGEYQKFDLNSHQKEIFRNLKDWIDKIKHGSLKQFTREDVEMIISLTVNFIRFVLNKHTTKIN